MTINYLAQVFSVSRFAVSIFVLFYASCNCRCRDVSQLQWSRLGMVFCIYRIDVDHRPVNRDITACVSFELSQIVTEIQVRHAATSGKCYAYATVTLWSTWPHISAQPWNSLNQVPGQVEIQLVLVYIGANRNRWLVRQYLDNAHRFIAKYLYSGKFLSMVQFNEV